MSFVPASRWLAPAGGGEARHAVWFLHGILGSGRNWTTFARRLIADAPGWGARLVDLRHHGDSADAPPPDDLAAAAGDLARLAQQEGGPDVVVGHSFGGKVALAWVRDDPACCREVWSLDSPPSAATPHSDSRAEIDAVFRALRAVPQPLASREDVVAAITGRGLSTAIAQWMTTNLAPGDGGYRWRFDLDGAARLIDAYFADDLWPVVYNAPIPVHLVRAARSDRWTPADRARLTAVDGVGRVRVHTLEDAGHWVHVDAPDALRALIRASLA